MTTATIDVTTDEFLSYAMAHNRLPFLREVALDGIDPSLGTVEVEVSITDRGRAVTRPFVTAVDVSSGHGLLKTPAVVLDPAVMSSIEERRPADLVVTVRHDEGVVTTHREDVQLLSSRHWVRGLTFENTSLELLAAHVMPNDPSIAALLAEARDRLLRLTGSASTEGYQADEQRTDAIVEAVYESARARGIGYSNPPASWDAGSVTSPAGEQLLVGGQKVRTPQEVFEGRVGTCLDTTLALASALEHVGINSLVWVVEGHAFLAYWRIEGMLPSTAGSDPASVANYVDLDVMRVIETTKLTTPGDEGTFRSPAHRATRAEYLSGAMERVHAVVDVRRARSNDILPLPAVSVGADGTTQVVEYVPAVHSGEHRVNAAAPSRKNEPAKAGPVPPRITSWKNSLLDLSLRNKLINFSARGTIQLAVPDGSLDHVEDRLNAGQPIQLRPSDMVDAVQAGRGARFGAQLPSDQLRSVLDDGALFCDVTTNSYLSRMRALAYKARTIGDETGANNLYVALGSLHWKIDGRPLTSPLILLPVHLVSVGRSHQYRIVLDESGASTPNYCLVEKLRQVDGLRVAELENPPEDDHGIDLDATFTAVRRAIAEKGLGYRVEESADLAILQFAKFRLWKDLDEHWSTLMEAPLVKHLVETPTDPFVDPAGGEVEADLDDLDAACPIPADASQLEAIAAATAGQTFVLEGPPGTGKSQTITNLLTRAVAEGKRVLFVAEKRAALDVVASRLASVGLGDFALDLHDKSSRPTVVREQLKRALDLTFTVDEQGLAALREDLHGARRALSRYATRLHEPNIAGLSYYSARTQALTLSDVPALPIAPRHLPALDPTAVAALRHALRVLPDTADPARPRRHHPWGFVRRVPSADTTAQILLAARRYDEAQDALPHTGPLRTVLDSAATTTDFATVASFVSAPPVRLADLDDVRTRSWADARDRYLSAVDEFLAKGEAHPGLNVVGPEALDLPLAEIRAAVESAQASGFFGRKKRIREAFAPLAELARSTVKPKHALSVVDALLETRAAADAVSPEAQGVVALRTPPRWNPWSTASKAHLDGQLVWLDAAARAVEQRTGEPAVPFVDQLRTFVAADAPVDPADEQRTRELAEASSALWEAAGTTPHDLADWLGDATVSEVWSLTRTGRSLGDGADLSLGRWLAFLEALVPLREAGLVEAADALLAGTAHVDDAVRAFDHGLAQASISERLAATGLDAFDAAAHEKAITRFAGSINSIRSELRTEIPAEVVDRRPFSPQTDRGQVGELRRELSKQRRGLKVRALLEKYGDLVTQLMPCVLVSPDSVARFFPVGSMMFDLVVFDEASQIRVADAIGAMGRARSVVVVGDSKQMPPTSFAEPADTSGNEDVTAEVMTVEDEESILSEAVQARIQRRWLSWHYRSKDESLIAFSNGRYYENKLSSFPAPTGEVDHAGRPVAGVSLERVDGTFLRSGVGRDLRTNPVEADAIVREIRQRFADSPDVLPSIGVVTFNMPQRTRIDTLLRDTEDPRILEALDGTNGEGLFVKNLENVQGDERDVILFSTAFSKNEKGNLPLNFGPLGNAGGERRLNVAITRARRKVIIFSSFDPSDIRADDTQSRGIKDLQAYLAMAAAESDRGGDLIRGASHIDRHRDDVAAALRDHGLVVDTDLGLSDFRIDLTLAAAESPDRPLVAVLLDGEGWAQRRTVGDRDGLPVSVLGGLMGWRRVERVWLPEWIEARDVVVERLLAAFEAAREAAARPAPISTAAVSRPAPVTPAVMVPPAPAPIASVPAPIPTAERASAYRLSGSTEFVPWSQRAAGRRATLDALPSPWAADQVQRLANEIIEAEGPVQLERLARLTASAFDLTRLNQARIDSIVRTVPRALKDRDGFAWPGGTERATWTGFRTASTDSPRPMAEIHPQEISNALVALCRDSYGMFEDELLKETLALFGWKRRTEAMVAPVRDALKRGIAAGSLQVGSNGLVSTP